MIRRPTTLPPPSREWAYFFDIDGTLVDIAADPRGVRVDEVLVSLVSGLYLATGGAVALITGRPIVDVDRLFHAMRIPAAGQHGAERRDVEGRVHRLDLHPERLDGARELLADAIARHPGLYLEDKGLSLALHYRRAPRMGGYAHRLMRASHARIGDEYALLTGKRVVEVRPTGRDKGRAVLEFMQEAPFRGRTPVFVGDDVTDEFGFATVNELGGLSIKVGSGKTIAHHRLATVGAVQAWLTGAAGQ